MCGLQTAEAEGRVREVTAWEGGAALSGPGRHCKSAEAAQTGRLFAQPDGKNSGSFAHRLLQLAPPEGESDFLVPAGERTADCSRILSPGAAAGSVPHLSCPCCSGSGRRAVSVQKADRWHRSHRPEVPLYLWTSVPSRLRGQRTHRLLWGNFPTPKNRLCLNPTNICAAHKISIIPTARIQTRGSATT